MTETIIRIEGLKGDTCVKSVEKSLTNLSGVERSLVDLDNGEAYVEYDDEVTNIEQMKQVIESTGLVVK